MTIKKFINLFSEDPNNIDFYVVSTDTNCNPKQALKLTPSVLKSFIGNIEINKKSIKYNYDVGAFIIPVNMPEIIFMSCGELSYAEWDDTYYLTI